MLLRRLADFRHAACFSSYRLRGIGSSKTKKSPLAEPSPRHRRHPPRRFGAAIRGSPTLHRGPEPWTRTRLGSPTLLEYSRTPWPSVPPGWPSLFLFSLLRNTVELVDGNDSIRLVWGFVTRAAGVVCMLSLIVRPCIHPGGSAELLSRHQGTSDERYSSPDLRRLVAGTRRCGRRGSGRVSRLGVLRSPFIERSKL